MKPKVQYVMVLFLCCLLLCSGVSVQAAEPQGKLSNKSDIRDLIQFQPTISTKYTFSLDKALQVCVYNKEKTDTGVVYMEYEVGEVPEDLTYQVGVFASENPAAQSKNAASPKSAYITNYKRGTGNPLLVPGAKYYVCFVKRDDCFEYYIQRTANGTTERVSIVTEYGKWNDAYDYFSLWIGESDGNWVTATVKNFKCYDLNGKDLGVEVSHTASYTYESVYQTGQQQNYDICEGAYYCSDKPELGLIVLGQDKKGYSQIGDSKTEFSYLIQKSGSESSTLYLAFPNGKQVFEYQYIQMTDGDGNLFKKLRDYKVTFVNGEETIVETIGVEQNYRLSEPENPKRKGATFKGWYLGNDEAFDFDSIITESVTLYAQWDGDAEQVFVPLEKTASEKTTSGDVNWPMIIAIASSVVIVSGCVVLGIWMLRRKKHV